MFLESRFKELVRSGRRLSKDAYNKIKGANITTDAHSLSKDSINRIKTYRFSPTDMPTTTQLYKKFSKLPFVKHLPKKMKKKAFEVFKKKNLDAWEKSKKSLIKSPKEYAKSFDKGTDNIIKLSKATVSKTQSLAVTLSPNRLIRLMLMKSDPVKYSKIYGKFSKSDLKFLDRYGSSITIMAKTADFDAAISEVKNNYYISETSKKLMLAQLKKLKKIADSNTKKGFNNTIVVPLASKEARAIAKRHEAYEASAVEKIAKGVKGGAASQEKLQRHAIQKDGSSHVSTKVLEKEAKDTNYASSFYSKSKIGKSSNALKSIRVKTGEQADMQNLETGRRLLKYLRRTEGSAKVDRAIAHARKEMKNKIVKGRHIDSILADSEIGSRFTRKVKEFVERSK